MRCFQLALLYPIIAVLFGWVLFGTLHLSSVTLFYAETFWLKRLLWSVAVIAAGLISGWAYMKIDHLWETVVVTRIFGSKSDVSATHKKKTRFLAYSASSFGTIIGSMAVLVIPIIYYFYSPLELPMHPVFALLIFTIATATPTGMHAYAGSGHAEMKKPHYVALGLVVACPLFALVINSNIFYDPELSTILILFFSVLPFLNALLDMVSIGITRTFLNRIVALRPSFRMIAVQISLDLIWAAICLSILIASTILVLEVFLLIPNMGIAFYWQEYLWEIQQDWRNGSALYLMVATTLVPTIVHVIVGLGAALTYRSNMLKQVANLLREKETAGAEKLNKAELQKAQITIWMANTGGIAFSTLLTFGAAYIIGSLGWWGISLVP